MSRLTRRAQFFIQQGLAEPQPAALSELRNKPAPHHPDHGGGRICGLLPATSKILLNGPGVKMQDERSPHVTAIPPAANGRCRRLRVNCDQAAFCRDCATWVAITSISAGDRQS